MAENTAIAWTEKTFNPWIGCFKVSPGCANCYAETLAVNRMKRQVWGPAKTTTRDVTSPENWKLPGRWDRAAAKRDSSPWAGAADPRMLVFCASMCDVFEDHPVANAQRPRLWELVRATPHLQWQILTKRPERILANLPADWTADGWPNVWLGTSIENVEYGWRADSLRQIPAVVRFISYEPALGPLGDLSLEGIDWVIYGGESGPGWRNHDLAWPRAMRRRCERGGVAFFYKQSAAPRTEMGIELDGEIVRNYPTPRRGMWPSEAHPGVLQLR